ncbi:MAG: AIR carboxylase family protein, partial [Synergistaceae bacterium]|nr:AIR carboxylase family protein [Synergistaceae bacterium]
MKQIAIIMGSDSDLAIAEKAADVLKKLDIKFELRVMSAHRTPDKVLEFA